MFHQRQHLGPCVILSVLLSLWMDLTSGEINIQQVPQYPVIGGSVTLTVTGVNGSILAFSWNKGLNTNPEYNILTYIPDDPSPLIHGPLYYPRVTPFPNGSLLISDLQYSDRSFYIVKIQVDQAASVSFFLNVYERLRKPTVTVSAPPRENYPFALTCDASKAERILWSRDRGSLPAHDLSRGNRTITFSKMKRSDSGDYRCEAENEVSNHISDPYTVTVAYGPDNSRITGETQVYPGSVISLTCSADSVPSPRYQWLFNGKHVGNDPILRIEHASRDHTGNYWCVVENIVTRIASIAEIIVYVQTGRDN